MLPSKRGNLAASKQCAKKVVSDSPGLLDFAIRLVNSVFNLSNGQVMFVEDSNNIRTVKSIGSLQVAIHVVQNRRAGEQKSHWDKTNKRHR